MSRQWCSYILQPGQIMVSQNTQMSWSTLCGELNRKWTHIQKHPPLSTVGKLYLQPWHHYIWDIQLAWPTSPLKCYIVGLLRSLKLQLLLWSQCVLSHIHRAQSIAHHLAWLTTLLCLKWPFFITNLWKSVYLHTTDFIQQISINFLVHRTYIYLKK